VRGERSSAPRNGSGFGNNVVAVTLKKRLTLLLLTALHIPSLTSRDATSVAGTEGFIPQEAEEPVSDFITLALPVAGLQPFSLAPKGLYLFFGLQGNCPPSVR